MKQKPSSRRRRSTTKSILRLDLTGRSVAKKKTKEGKKGSDAEHRFPRSHGATSNYF